MKYEKYLISENNNELNILYKKYKEQAKGDKNKLHGIIKNTFVNNKYARSSNRDVDYMWGLYKKDFPS